MVWVKIDDRVAHHPKFVDAGPVAAWLWVCGNCYCNKYLTDGFIPANKLRTVADITNVKKWADRLVEVGLWEAHEKNRVPGYLVHDFHDHNPPAAQVRASQSHLHEVRSGAGKIGGQRSAVTRSKKKQDASNQTKQNGSNSQASERSPVPSREDKDPEIACAREGDDAEAVAALIDRYRDDWRQVYGMPAGLIQSPLVFAKAGEQLRAVGAETMARALEGFFAERTDAVVVRSRHDFSLFLRNPTRWAAAEVSAGAPPEHPWSDCRHEPKCQDAWCHGRLVDAEQTGDDALIASIRTLNDKYRTVPV